jgi:L-aminopeptidase/D-esterase-like protein
VVAGARGEDGRTLVDARTLVRAGGLATPPPGENTTIGVVATNAKLTQVQAKKMAMMAHDGLARAISPAHLPSDGDAIFSMATGTWDGEVELGILGALAAEVMADAIVRAARQATGVAGYPAARDLEPPSR